MASIQDRTGTQLSGVGVTDFVRYGRGHGRRESVDDRQVCHLSFDRRATDAPPAIFPRLRLEDPRVDGSRRRRPGSVSPTRHVTAVPVCAAVTG